MNVYKTYNPTLRSTTLLHPSLLPLPLPPASSLFLSWREEWKNKVLRRGKEKNAFVSGGTETTERLGYSEYVLRFSLGSGRTGDGSHTRTSQATLRFCYCELFSYLGSFALLLPVQITLSLPLTSLHHCWKVFSPLDRVLLFITFS